MKIGCPTEIKNQEYRVGVTPAAALSAINAGHQVAIQKGAGLGAGFKDEEYVRTGAQILDTAEQIFNWAEMIVKVKEPQASERKMLRKDQILFTYLHLAADRPQTDDLLNSGVTAIAYETVTAKSGGLPLLAPMSEVAGRLAPQVGAWSLQKANGGRGVLMGGVPGVSSANVMVLGGGVVGTQAARIAAGMGADVTVYDLSLERMKYLDDSYRGVFKTQYSSTHAIEAGLKSADMVIGAVLIPGAVAPKLVRKTHLSLMKEGAVLVDVAIDQGGCFETSKATTHDEPIYTVNNVIHYCVANMPGAVARTSTEALSNATLPFMMNIANKGWKQACRDDVHLANGLNTHEGVLTCPAVGEAFDIPAVNPEKVLG